MVRGQGEGSGHLLAFQEAPIKCQSAVLPPLRQSTLLDYNLQTEISLLGIQTLE